MEEWGKGRNGEALLLGGRLGRLLLLLPLSLSFLLPLPREARAQEDVVELLRHQRSVARAGELLAEMEGKVAPRPVVDVAPASIYVLWHDRVQARRRFVADSLAEAAARARVDSLAQLPPTLDRIAWIKVRPDAQGAFVEMNMEAYWVAAPRLPALDSIDTPVLRARLNGLFGAPTRNSAAAEQEGYAGSEFVQFEYWFAVNDTIPVLVLDRDGPFGRGLLIAGNEADRRYLPLLVADLAARLADARPTPYTEYYHAYDRRQWYQTGFDGTEYFTREARAPRWAGTRSRNDRWRIFR